MRVALLTNLIPPYHKPLYELLSKRWDHLRLFISTPMEVNRPWQPEWTGLDVTVQKCFTIRRTWRHPQFGETLSIHFPADTFQQLARYRPDVIVSAEMGFRTLVACMYAAANPNSRLFVWSEVTSITERGRGQLRQRLRRFIARRANGFLAVGRDGVSYIESLGVPRQRIFQIAYSTNLEPFTNIQLQREASRQKCLLFSGQLIERKGLMPFLQTLVRWAETNPDQSVEFSLIGDGPVRQQLAEVPLPPNVKLISDGSLQYSQLPSVYSEAGIFVLPTLADTWAVAVNEALASGLPVLGSLYSQAVQEMVDDGKNGWTFRPDVPEEMYSALNRALTTPLLQMDKMREHARSRALEITPESTAAICEQALVSFQ